MPTSPTPEFVAAVDLGSNSFHAVIARLVGGELTIVDRMRERVRLAGGLDAHHHLSQEVRDRALEALTRFGERFTAMPPGSVRVVGTNSLRSGRALGPFLEAASDALGHPVEVISGREEARLIYLGVAHSISADARRRLVVDIGGGSTEAIVGEGFDPIEADTMHMGCVSYSRRFFGDGRLTAERMAAAESAAAQELRSIRRQYRDLGWDEAVGASGTILAIAAIAEQSGWGDGSLTPEAVARVRDAVVSAGSVAELELPGLSASRAPVIAGGVAILDAVFRSLRIKRMRTSQDALREGVLYDLVGRLRHEDVRDRTVRACAERYHVDRVQAARVGRVASLCFEQVEAAWGLDPQSRQFLSWACRLHEIGLAIAYSGYHKHGAYLAQHSDLPGFSRDAQLVLATLLLHHRRRIRRAQFKALPKQWQKKTFRLAVLLRLAVALNRSRSPGNQPDLQLRTGTARYLAVEFPAGWLDEHSLTRLDLDKEVALLADAGFELKIVG